MKVCFEIIKEFKLNVNKDMIYTIAAFHDLGYKENPENHGEVSREIFKSDKNMAKFFSKDEINIISDAIIDHRASLEYEARSIYGKIVSSKYGKDGYAKMYYPDKKYLDYLETMQNLLEDKEKFIQEEMKIAKKIRRK